MQYGLRISFSHVTEPSDSVIIGEGNSTLSIPFYIASFRADFTCPVILNLLEGKLSSYFNTLSTKSASEVATIGASFPYFLYMYSPFSFGVSLFSLLSLAITPSLVIFLVEEYSGNHLPIISEIV
nr:MAG TPA: hypothetical protein [Bacteriophage sp.]